MLSTLSQEQIYNNICVPAGINIDYQHFPEVVLEA
jgi:hypothetical protein